MIIDNLPCSIREIEYATDPALNEIVGLIASGREPLVKNIEQALQRLYIAAYNNGYTTKTIQVCTQI